MTNEVSSDVTRLSALGPDDARLLYEQYSEWARHLHNLIWLAASFGIGIALGGLTLFERLTPGQFAGAGVGCLVVMYSCHVLAERNRIQWMNHWRVLNALEAYWGIRNLGENPNGPLFGFERGQTKGGTRAARVALMWVCGAIWVVAIAFKAATPPVPADTVPGTTAREEVERAAPPANQPVAPGATAERQGR